MSTASKLNEKFGRRIIEDVNPTPDDYIRDDISVIIHLKPSVLDRYPYLLKEIQNLVARYDR